ncbi:hypothetical protein [Flavobacterium rhizosphaerae]|uniref:Lipoprotein n=1 Tax=Flavobacterium rhizosphaerae TaxID=3163298 RepID=A0ABW8YUJ6_9FLAO
MKIVKLKFLSFLLVLGLLAACSLDAPEQSCNFTAQMSTTGVTGPDTAVVNEPITLQVSFVIANSCGVFSNFHETNGYPKSIVARVNYIGCDCGTTSTTGTQPYVFKSEQPGEYILRFLTEDTSAPIEKTITVTAD